MTRRLLGPGLGLLAMLVGILALTLTAPDPAKASHITEPTRPVVGISAIRFYDYPNLSTKAACDGSTPYRFDKARVEFDALIERVWPDPAAPSEHWTADVLVRRGDGRIAWDSRWNHQNSPPHKNVPTRLETAQANTYNLQEHPGLWTVEASVVGDVSGNEFETVCTILVEAP